MSAGHLGCEGGGEGRLPLSLVHFMCCQTRNKQALCFSFAAAHGLPLFIDPSLNCGLTQLCPFSAVPPGIIATIEAMLRSNDWPLFSQHLFNFYLTLFFWHSHFFIWEDMNWEMYNTAVVPDTMNQCLTFFQQTHSTTLHYELLTFSWAPLAKWNSHESKFAWVAAISRLQSMVSKKVMWMFVSIPLIALHPLLLRGAIHIGGCWLDSSPHPHLQVEALLFSHCHAHVVVWLLCRVRIVFNS